MIINRVSALAGPGVVVAVEPPTVEGFNGGRKMLARTLVSPERKRRQAQGMVVLGGLFALLGLVVAVASLLLDMPRNPFLAGVLLGMSFSLLGLMWLALALWTLLSGVPMKDP